MRAIDPRLLRYARAVQGFLVVSVVLGGLGALLIVAQAWLLADVVSSAFSGHRGLDQLHLPLAILLLVVVGRAALAWASLRSRNRATRERSPLGFIFSV